MTESKYAPQLKYQRAKVRHFTLSLPVTTQADVIAKLDEVPSKQAYIVRLIRDDIAREKGVALNDTHGRESEGRTVE